MDDPVEEYMLLTWGRTLEEMGEETMAKSPSGRKVTQTMSEWSKGQLHSGSKTGPKVSQTPTGQKQAVAIALSQQRKADAKRRK
jgi:hypothetical protein